MNDQQRAAMQMALEALDCRYNDNRVNAAITALREALAQPQDNLNCKSVQARLATSWGYVKVQPQGEWVDLTVDEIEQLYLQEPDGTHFYQGFAQAVIAKFKEKNTPPVVPQVVTEGNASEVRSTDTGEPKCVVCGTTENLHKENWHGYRCDSEQCVCY